MLDGSKMFLWDTLHGAYFYARTFVRIGYQSIVNENTPKTPPAYTNDSDYFSIRRSEVVPITPKVAIGLLEQHKINGATRLEAISNMVSFCYSLMHSANGPVPPMESFLPTTNGQFEMWWGDYGAVPLDKIFNGTSGPIVINGAVVIQTMRWTRGCHMTVDFMREALRYLNIPVRYTQITHALPRFVTERLYLSHGDDPYFGIARLTPLDPTSILMPEADFQNLFATYMPNDVLAFHIADWPQIVAEKLVPNWVLAMYMYDKERNGIDPLARESDKMASMLMQPFATLYYSAPGVINTSAWLSAKLWTNLKNRINSSTVANLPKWPENIDNAEDLSAKLEKYNHANGIMHVDPYLA